MTETSGSTSVGQIREDTTRRATTAPEPTGWAGWIMFATCMMVLVGTIHVIDGLVAVFDDEYFLVTDNGLVVEMDYTAWGWAHIIGGAVVIAAGLSLLSGRMWARVVGVVLAVLSIVVNFVFLPAYPAWGLIAITLNGFVIWALTVHGDEARSLGRASGTSYDPYV